MLGSVIQDVLVDLVGDGEDVEFNAQVSDQFQFGAGEDLSRGIVRGVENDGFGVFGEGSAKFFLVKGLFSAVLLGRA